MVEASSLAALASRFVDTDSLPWVETGPGSKMKVIYHDAASGLLTILGKLERGEPVPVPRPPLREEITSLPLRPSR